MYVKMWLWFRKIYEEKKIIENKNEVIININNNYTYNESYSRI